MRQATVLGMIAMCVAIGSERAAAEATPNHTSFGVSQFLAGNLDKTESHPLRLVNPGSRTHVASILVYTGPEVDAPGDPDDFENDLAPAPTPTEKFLGCLNVRITSHGSFLLEKKFLTEDLEPGPDNTLLLIPSDITTRPAINPNVARTYVEIVSVPESPVTIRSSGSRRYGDGLGLNVVVFSYDGKLLLGVACDPDLMPDHDVFVECLRKAFGELASAV